MKGMKEMKGKMDHNMNGMKDGSLRHKKMD
jgi:hypothetical protein